MSNSHKKIIGIKRIKKFFLISHGIPFFLTIIFMLLENSIYISNNLFSNLIYLSLLSPTFAAFFIIYYHYDQKERKSFWTSVIDFKRISWKWYLIIISFPFLIRLMSSVFSYLFTSDPFQFHLSPDMTIIYAVILLFFGPIPEELGWRGVLFPELQKLFNFNISVLIVGFMWAIWHLPLFFVKGTYQNQLGMFTPLFWNFMLAIIFLSFIYGLIFNKSNKSIFAIILFHYMENLTGESIIMTSNARLLSTFLIGIVALTIFKIYLNKSNNYNKNKKI